MPLFTLFVTFSVLYFSSCIPPHSDLTLSLNHHLCARRLYSTFFSFHPRKFDSSIAQTQTALQRISSWMSANLPTLNSSKNEFLIIGLKQQLSKTDNFSLNTTHSARNLGFIFDEHLTFSDQISSLSKSTRLRHIRLRMLTAESAATLVHAFVTSRVDYVMSFLPGLQVQRSSATNCDV